MNKKENQEKFWEMVEKETDPKKKQELMQINVKALGLDKLKEKGFRPKLA